MNLETCTPEEFRAAVMRKRDFRIMDESEKEIYRGVAHELLMLPPELGEPVMSDDVGFTEYMADSSDRAVLTAWALYLAWLRFERAMFGGE